MKDVKFSLTKVSGVGAVEITVRKKWVFFSDYSDVHAVVTFDPAIASMERLVKAIKSASSPLSTYKARVIEK